MECNTACKLCSEGSTDQYISYRKSILCDITQRIRWMLAEDYFGSSPCFLTQNYQAQSQTGESIIVYGAPFLETRLQCATEPFFWFIFVYLHKELSINSECQSNSLIPFQLQPGEIEVHNTSARWLCWSLWNVILKIVEGK